MVNRSRDIFADSGVPAVPPPPPVADQPRKRGRPSAPENHEKVTVTLTTEQIRSLDIISANIRGGSGNVVDRSSLIRAIIAAVEDSGLDLGTAIDENDVHRIVRDRLAPV
jgi:hypothetical protein